MYHLRVSRADCSSSSDSSKAAVVVSIFPNSTLGELRRAIWNKTGVCWSHLGRCQILSNRGVPLPSADNDDLILRNAGLADWDVIQLLEDKSALKSGLTYLNVAAIDGNTEALRYLVENYPSLLEEHDGLKYTGDEGQGDGAQEILIGIGNDSEKRDDFRNTPLHYASLHGNRRAIEMFECGGADVNAIKSIGVRPLNFTKYFPDCTSVLIEGGGCVDSIDMGDGSFPSFASIMALCGYRQTPP